MRIAMFENQMKMGKNKNRDTLPNSLEINKYHPI
jgi:hypothetical protein